MKVLQQLAQFITASPKPRTLSPGMRAKLGYSLPRTLSSEADVNLELRKPRTFSPRKFIKEKITVKKVVLGLGLLPLLIFGIFYLLILIEPSAQPQNVIISNISDHQVTISWVTAKPTKGEIIISPDGKFPLLPVLASKTYLDDREKNLKKVNSYRTHHITVGKLELNKIYFFRIYQGWKRKYESQFKTGSTFASINPPNPVYGRVIKANKTPIVGALVYLWVTNGTTPSAFLSTLTNKEGRWSLDLSNLKTADFKNRYKLTSKSTEKLVIDTGRERVRSATSSGKDKPWPDLVVK